MLRFVRNSRSRHPSRAFESLEQRQLLAGDGVLPNVVINEFLTANVTSLTTRIRATESSEYSSVMAPDWVELYNQTSNEMDLSGYHLTDSINQATKWTFPSGTTIEPNGYLVVYASGNSITNTMLDLSGKLHADFKLRPDGEYLALTDPSGNVVHSYGDNYPVQRVDISYGLTDDGSLLYFDSPTPGSANSGSTFLGVAQEVKFDIDRGFYSEPIDVTMTTAESESEIWYTTDGTEPSPTNGLLFDSAVRIDTTTNLRAAVYKDGFIPSFVKTQTYLYLDEVLQQDGEDITSAPWGDFGPDWEIDPEIVNHADEVNRITSDDFLSIPTVSLTTDWDLFFGEQGIYPWDPAAGIGVALDDYEIPVSFELFDNQGQSAQAYSTVQIVGGGSPRRDGTNWRTDKLSMRVKFNENIGKPDFKHPVFGANAAEVFSTLTIDARFNNTWSYGGSVEPEAQRARALYLRDQFAADLQNATGGYAPHGISTHVYINGVYWGVHRLHERPDEDFAASYLGGDNDDFDSIKHNPNLAVNGTTDEFNRMLATIRQDLSDSENYNAARALVDVDGLISYILVNLYGGNSDWDRHNWYASFDKAKPNGKWRFHSWDAEKVLRHVAEDLTGRNTGGGPTEIHNAFLANEEYKMRFFDIVREQMFHGGVFTPETALELFEFRVAELDSAIRAESARWGDNQQERPFTRQDWLDNVQSFRDSYFPQRTDNLLGQLRNRGLWVEDDLLPPEFMINGVEQYGGYAGGGSELTITAPEGTIYYTIDGSDPRREGGDVSGSAMTYDSAIVLNKTTTINARLRQADGDWSPLSKARFSTAAPADRTNLRISEFNYHPAAVTEAEIAAGFHDEDEFEYIELVNIADHPIDLTNVQLEKLVVGNKVEGIQFDFATSAITELAAGERVLVTENIAAFELRYGSGLPVGGKWSGKLGNNNEIIRLVASDEVIHEFHYNDNWYVVADGRGHSLQIRDETSNDFSLWGQLEGWAPSNQLGGSPGIAELPRIPGDSTGDGVFDSVDLITVLQLGEYEDDIPFNSNFDSGDWNGDGDFSSQDMIFVLQFGNYASRVRTNSVANTAPSSPPVVNSSTIGQAINGIPLDTDHMVANGDDDSESDEESKKKRCRAIDRFWSLV